MEKWSQYSLFALSEKEFQCTTRMGPEFGEMDCLLFVRRSNVFSGFLGD